MVEQRTEHYRAVVSGDLRQERPAAAIAAARAAAERLARGEPAGLPPPGHPPAVSRWLSPATPVTESADRAWFGAETATVRGIVEEAAGVDGHRAGERLERLEEALAAGLSEPLLPPAKPSAALLAAFLKLATAGHHRVGVYGAGTHTRAAGGALADPPVEVVCVIDDDPRRAGRRLFGFPILSAAAALGLGLDAVVLSSDSFEDELWTGAAGLRAAGIPVLRLYGGEAADTP